MMTDFSFLAELFLKILSSDFLFCPRQQLILLFFLGASERWMETHRVRLNDVSVVSDSAELFVRRSF